MRHPILLALLGAALLAGCGGDGDGGMAAQNTTAAPAEQTSAAPTDTIRITDFEFEPSPATVTTRQKIAVPNDDAAPHTLTHEPATGEPLFDTGTLRGRQKGSFTAPKPGTYEIFCEIHPFMKGEIEVVAG